MGCMRHAALPVSKPDRDQITALIRDNGEPATIARLGISRQTLYRVVAGLPVYPGTHALIRERLDGGR